MSSGNILSGGIPEFVSAIIVLHDALLVGVGRPLFSAVGLLRRGFLFATGVVGAAEGFAELKKLCRVRFFDMMREMYRLRLFLKRPHAESAQSCAGAADLARNDIISIFHASMRSD